MHHIRFLQDINSDLMYDILWTYTYIHFSASFLLQCLSYAGACVVLVYFQCQTVKYRLKAPVILKILRFPVQ